MNNVVAPFKRRLWQAALSNAGNSFGARARLQAGHLTLLLLRHDAVRSHNDLEVGNASVSDQCHACLGLHLPCPCCITCLIGTTFSTQAELSPSARAAGAIIGQLRLYHVS
jgi:predicted transporter